MAHLLQVLCSKRTGRREQNMALLEIGEPLLEIGIVLSLIKYVEVKSRKFGWENCTDIV